MAGTIYHGYLLPVLSKIGEITFTRWTTYEKQEMIQVRILIHHEYPWNYFEAELNITEDKRLSPSYKYKQKGVNETHYVLEDLYDKMFDYYWPLHYAPRFYVPPEIKKFAIKLCEEYFPAMQDLSDA